MGVGFGKVGLVVDEEGTTDLVGGGANVRRGYNTHPLSSLGTDLERGDWVSVFMWAWLGFWWMGGALLR
ncbi:hypothetical protein VNO77_05821 [Canavalia gladiata]|uniref:Uncharacterized protein n=1 Tax=Canavalia gladiata TaxID=3824 RepID=A0AAN9N133_CANGL